MVKTIVAVFDTMRDVDGKYKELGIELLIRPVWWCKIPDCTSTRMNGFAMMLHLKHDHEIPTNELEFRTGFLVRKTETATDAAPETQNGNT